MAEKATCYLYVKRDGEWQLLGQYPTISSARRIERDYRSRGLETRVVKEDQPKWGSTHG